MTKMTTDTKLSTKQEKERQNLYQYQNNTKKMQNDQKNNIKKRLKMTTDT